jgi:hypothetical protein
MHQLDQKKLLIERIMPYLTGAPADAAQRLLQQSVSDLETILTDCITKKSRAQATEQVKQHADELRRDSQLEGSFVHACLAVINNRRLAPCESNRAMLESLLNPGEEPSAKLYAALAEQYPTKFAWETPQAKPTKEDQRAAFELFVRENNLSSVDANFNLFKEGASVEHYAGASQAEQAARSAEAAREHQTWLRTKASPLELRAEARYESQNQAAANQQAYAEATLEAQKQRDQYVGYKPLPAHIDRNALINASKDELRKWSRLYGQFQLNTALRAPQ